MNTKTAFRIATTTVMAAALTYAPWAAQQQRPAVKPVAHVCIAEVKLFEDGSWGGGRMLFDGKVVITAPWERKMTEVFWTPGWKGTVCTLTVI